MAEDRDADIGQRHAGSKTGNLQTAAKITPKRIGQFSEENEPFLLRELADTLRRIFSRTLLQQKKVRAFETNHHGGSAQKP